MKSLSNRYHEILNEVFDFCEEMKDLIDELAFDQIKYNDRRRHLFDIHQQLVWDFSEAENSEKLIDVGIPKYKVNDEVYVISKGAPHVRIKNVLVKYIGDEIVVYKTVELDEKNPITYKSNPQNEYFCYKSEITYDLSNGMTNVAEEDLFFSKEELIQTL